MGTPVEGNGKELGAEIHKKMIAKYQETWVALRQAGPYKVEKACRRGNTKLTTWKTRWLTMNSEGVAWSHTKNSGQRTLLEWSKIEYVDALPKSVTSNNVIFIIKATKRE